MINKKNLIEDIMQHENVLADANYYYKQGYDERQKEILNIIERQPVVDAEGVDEAYLELVKENAEMKKQLANEPRFMLDKESICYGCSYFKKVEDCGGILTIDDIICGGACDCANPCFEGSQNDYGLEVEDVSQDCSAGRNEILDIINRQPVLDTKSIDEAYLELVKENAELKKRLEFGGWILADFRVPDNDDYILLSFENFSLPQIGRFEKDKDGGGAFYIGDDEHSCVSYGLFVDAWQPCPKGYIPKGKEKRFDDFSTGWKKAMMDTFLGSRKGDVR